ncbi:hypothetical protein TNCV_1316331 [Trichonephila clavipes]|nr:hypothetical protein TNCV_1316331 [Trichonephila clavipes]
MEDIKVLNEYGGTNENDFGRMFVNLEPVSSRHTYVIENIRNESQPIAYKEILNYSLHSSVNSFCLLIQDNWRDTEKSDAKGLVSFLQRQTNFQEVQPNTVFEYNEFSSLNTEVQGSKQGDSVNISTVRECIRTACDCLLGMNPQNNYLISENFDFRYDHSIPSEIHLFDPKVKPSKVQREHFYTNSDMEIENKCERVELKNKLTKFNSINSGLKFLQTYINWCAKIKDEKVFQYNCVQKLPKSTHLKP